MVITNPPRFFRENDIIVFATKLSNLSEKQLEWESSYTATNASSMKQINDKLIINDNIENNTP